MRTIFKIFIRYLFLCYVSQKHDSTMSPTLGLSNWAGVASIYWAMEYIQSLALRSRYLKIISSTLDVLKMKHLGYNQAERMDIWGTSVVATSIWHLKPCLKKSLRVWKTTQVDDMRNSTPMFKCSAQKQSDRVVYSEMYSGVGWSRREKYQINKRKSSKNAKCHQDTNKVTNILNIS